MTHSPTNPLTQEETRSRIEICSPYLKRLLERHPNDWSTLWESGPQTALDDVMKVCIMLRTCKSVKEWMHDMRIIKQRLALVTATADISALWNVEQVTSALSTFADETLQQALNIALCEYDLKPEQSGIALFALGKLGTQSLNYSSDIDIIAIFDMEHSSYGGEKSLQTVMNRIVQETIRLLEERTQEGYVFRTDLRLRPDPASTPPAVSFGGAMAYYESVGQNWERAALTKARFVAGDSSVGENFLHELRPFLWRKHLDFAMIDDIYSIKRQMHTGTGEIETAAKHNVKTGRGGIREIEFYVQTLQLVWGGRMPELRILGTVNSLRKLVEADLLDAKIATTLEESYFFLRNLEHRLQMVNDQQTHSIPDGDEELARFASFMGYEHADQLLEDVLKVIRRVHRLFLDSMHTTGPLGKEGGYLVFTGSDPDPETLENLEQMGYRQPRTISDIIQGWHRGHRRATRSKRSRQVLTEIVPNLLKAMATTSHPDQAFIRFDDFLSQLPAGVQIFSLIASNPEMLDTLATVMGSAPALGETLGRYPAMLEAVIHSDFTRLPTPEEIEQLLRPELEHAQDYEDVMRILRITRSEREFQAGVALLKGTPAHEVTQFLSELAEDILQEAVHHTHTLFAERYGRIPNGRFAILSLGKLGAKELTFGSDVDIFFIYDAPDDAESDGETAIAASVYYNRLAQRIVNALTSLTREGRLYEVDSRMRPLGAEGPLACKLSVFENYYRNSAWTFERMALCKARLVASDNDALSECIAEKCRDILSREYDTYSIYKAAIEMRRKIADRFRNVSGWHIKHGRGGTIDVDFIAQCILLTNAHTHPALLEHASINILKAAHDEGLIPSEAYEAMHKSLYFQLELQAILRLCTNESTTRDKTPGGLAVLLQKRFDVPSLEVLYSDLLHHQLVVREWFETQTALALEDYPPTS